MRITDATIQTAGAVVVTAFVSLGAYAGLATAGVVAPAPWSPLGQHQQQQQEDRSDQLDDLRDFATPRGDSREV